MPNVAPIVISDGLATPVSHTFHPNRIDKDGYRRFVDRQLGVQALYPEIHIGFFPARSTTSRDKGATIDGLATKVVLKVLVPVPDISSPTTGTGLQPAPSKAFEEMVSITFTHPIRGGKQTREDAFAYIKNLLNLATTKTVVVDMEDYYT